VHDSWESDNRIFAAFSIWELHYNYWNRFQAKYFFNGWGFIKWESEMLVLDCFIPEYWSIVRGAVCVYLGTSPDYGWSYAFLSAALLWLLV
jgi:hypothetical protein